MGVAIIMKNILLYRLITWIFVFMCHCCFSIIYCGLFLFVSI